MTPLPTIARWPVGFAGRYDSLIMRGGSVLPALTPSRPPQPRAARASASKTSICSFDAAATAVATSAMRARGEVPGRRVREVAGQLGRAGRHRAAGRAALDGGARPGAPATSVISRRPAGRHLLLQGAVAVAGEEDPLDDDLAGDVGRQRRRRRRAWWRARRACRRRGRTRPRRRAAGRVSGRRRHRCRSRPRRPPPGAGTASVWPTLPSNPIAVSDAGRGRAGVAPAPFVPTGTPTASAEAGTDRETDTTTSPARATDGVGSNVATLSVRTVVTLVEAFIGQQSARRRRRRAPATSSRLRRPASGPSSTAGPTGG